MSYLLKEILRDKLYALNNECFDSDIIEILECLNFVVNPIKYRGMIKEFLYGYLDKTLSLNSNERKCLSAVEFMSYTELSSELPLCFVLLDEQGGSYRNDLSCKITKFFMRAFQRKPICCFWTGEKLQFTGVQYDGINKTSDVIISEWFSFENFEAKGDALVEIDASTYNCKSRNLFYADYLYSICRVYDKYPETKMYWTYGCTEMAFLSGMDELIDDYDRIDREATCAINRKYYSELYQDDYYPLIINEDDEFDFIEDIDDEFEWTMLELELEQDEIDVDDYEDYENYDEFIDIDDSQDIIKMNPAEMLAYIQGKRD
ncbi:MAG: hypothetical protein K2N61_07285 [Lachnospiraceae bacterium]|nr:hypothetical protein [Lachnospiraceae bacterium]